MHACVFDWLHTEGLYEQLCKPVFAGNRREHTSGEGWHSGARFSFSEGEEVFQRTQICCVFMCPRRLIGDQLQP